jgi:hypothetical protein
MLAAAADGATELDQLLSETLSASGDALLPAEQRCELHEQVEAAITTHYHWLDLLNAAVASGESPYSIAEIKRDDLCPIGVWLSTTISDTLRTMPLYYVTKSRHAVFHRSMTRLLAAAKARQPQAVLSMQPGGDMMMVAVALLRTLQDWRAIATLDSGLPRLPSEASARDR